MKEKFFKKISYVADTFEGLVEELKAFTKEKLGTEYEDFAQDDVAMLLIEWISYVGASVSWGTDRKLSDNIMELTRSLKIANYMSESEGLKLKGRTPQMTEMTLRNENLTPVLIEKDSIVKTSVGDFLIPNNVTVANGSDIEVMAYEMIKVSADIISDGEIFQVVNLIDIGLDDINTSIVYNKTTIISSPDDENIGIENWTEIDFLPHINEDVIDDYDYRYFTVDYVNNKITFGDGITGRALPQGTINISFYMTRGLTVDIPQIKNNSISKILNPVTEDEYLINVVSNTQGDGASNGDIDLEHIKYLYKSFKRARDVAITLEDFEFFAMNCNCSSGKVAMAKAYTWKNVEENTDVISIEKSIYNLFNTFMSDLQDLYSNFKRDVDLLKSDLVELKTFISYVKESAASFNLTFNSLKTSYSSTIETSKIALLNCKNKFSEKITLEEDIPSYYYDFSNERNIMDSSFSEFNILLKTFGNLKDINGRTFDDYILLINNYSKLFDVDLDAFLEDNYKQLLEVLFIKLNDQIQKILYAPETVGVISLVVLTIDENGFYKQANRNLIKELYLSLNKVSAPNIVLNIQDGYSNILNGRVKLKVKIKKIDDGFSFQVIKEKISSYLSETYKKLNFGEGISIYDVTTGIEENVSGVKRVGVEIFELIPNGEEKMLTIDEFGDLDMSDNDNKLLQSIVIEVS